MKHITVHPSSPRVAQVMHTILNRLSDSRVATVELYRSTMRFVADTGYSFVLTIVVNDQRVSICNGWRVQEYDWNELDVVACHVSAYVSGRFSAL